jgi:hypothetical protein
MAASEPKDTEPSPINRQYVQRCLFNWRRQLNIDLTVEEHAVFRQNKKHYMKVEHLDPSLVCKMIQRFHPQFQFPSNPIPIPQHSQHSQRPQNNNIEEGMWRFVAPSLHPSLKCYEKQHNILTEPMNQRFNSDKHHNITDTRQNVV